MKTKHKYTINLFTNILHCITLYYILIKKIQIMYENKLIMKNIMFLMYYI